MFPIEHFRGCSSNRHASFRGVYHPVHFFPQEGGGFFPSKSRPKQRQAPRACGEMGPSSPRRSILKQWRFIHDFMLGCKVDFGWWFQPTPLKNMRKSNWKSFPGRGENQKYLKPPPSWCTQAWWNYIEEAFFFLMFQWRSFPNSGDVPSPETNSISVPPIYSTCQEGWLPKGNDRVFFLQPSIFRCVCLF